MAYTDIHPPTLTPGLEHWQDLVTHCQESRVRKEKKNSTNPEDTILTE